MIIYFNGNFINENDCKISPFDRGFMFADGVYEVVRYNGKRFFEFESHMNRLKTGLDFLEISLKNFNKLFEICSELIESNNFKNRESIAYIQITRGISKPRSHLYLEEKIKPTVFINLSPLPAGSNKNGVNIILGEDIRWLRCNIKTISLLPNVLSLQKSYLKNASETVLVRDGFVTEGTHTNFCGIRGGCLYTAPESNFILPGITRKTVLNLCRKINIPYKEIFIKENELNSFSEFMLTSTTMEVTPVIKINDLAICKGKAGEITLKIQKTYSEFFYS